MNTVKPAWMLVVFLGALFGAGCGVKLPPVQPVEQWNGQSPWGEETESPVLVVLPVGDGTQEPSFQIVGIDAEAERIVFIKWAPTLADAMRFSEKVPSNSVIQLRGLRAGAQAGRPGDHQMPVVAGTLPPPKPAGGDFTKARLELQTRELVRATNVFQSRLDGLVGAGGE